MASWPDSVSADRLAETPAGSSAACTPDVGAFSAPASGAPAHQARHQTVPRPATDGLHFGKTFCPLLYSQDIRPVRPPRQTEGLLRECRAPAGAEVWAPQLPGSRSQPHTMLSCPLWRPSALQTSVRAFARCRASPPSLRVSLVAHSSSRQAQAAVRLSQRHLSSSASFSVLMPSGIYLHSTSCP